MAGETKFITWSGGPAGDYICTGSADQGPINSALAWANANPGNIIKMRGSGNIDSPHKYHIQGQVRVGSSTVWTAEPGVCLWVPDGACGSSVSNCVFPDGTPVIGQIGSYITGIEIYGFEIDGNCQNQSTQLGYAHGVVHSAGSGVERLIQLRGLSGSQTKAADIYIHDMNAHDAFGEFVHVRFAKKVRVKNNLSGNHQHENVMFVEVSGDGNEVSDCIMYGITSDCLRLDNCQNVPVHDCSFLTYDGPNANGATKFGHSCMQIANEANKSLQTDNITVYNNFFEGKNLSGIWINDQLKTAGATPQSVYIHHNKFSNNIGWADWAWWASGINIGPWGNGVRIEYNTFEGCYGNTIQCNNPISSNSTHTILVKNNNIINTAGLRSGSSGGPTTQGWGIWNSQPTKFVIKAENNYMSGNKSGDYKGLTPISISDEPILNAGPDGGTEEDDPDDPVTPVPSTGVYVPTAGQILNTDFGYVQRAADDFSAYINGTPFGLHRLAPAGGRVVSKSHSPQVVGSNLSDLGLEGSEVTLDCFAPTMDDAYKVMAAFSKPGRSFIELGGAHKGYFMSGIMPDHASSFDWVQGDTGRENLEFNVNFETEFPYIENMNKTVRDHYIFGSCAVSSDDIHDGNLVKNPNYSSWTFKDKLEWAAVGDAADNSWRNVKHAPELNQWCAVAESGTDNRIMVSGPNIVSDITGNNKHGLHTMPGVAPVEGGLYFDGTGFAEVPLPDIANATNFTIYSRFSTSFSGAVQAVFGIGNSGVNNPMLMIGLASAGTPLFYHRGDTGTSASLSATGAINDGLEHELCVVKEGTTYTFYVDGIQATQRTGTVETLTVNGATIGKLPRLTSVNIFNGTIYSTRIFSGALTAAQVPNADLYTTGLLQAYSTVSDSDVFPPGQFWVTPPGLKRVANRNNNWRGLAWCPDWMTWVATSVTGTGTACITSEDGGVTWLQKTTPGSNGWGNCIYIPVNDTLPNGRLLAFAQSGGGARTMYSDDKCATWAEVALPSDIASNNLLASAYAQSLDRIVIVSYGGSANKRAVYTDDYGLTYISVTSPAQKWTGLIWAEIMGLFIACSEDGTQQIMTSPTGLEGSWTLQTTPYAYSTVSPGGSTVVKTLTGVTEAGWNYTTLATTYSTSVNPMKVFTTDAPGTGNHIRIDKINARLRTVATGPTAYLKVTAKTATIAETTLKEWTETATTYQQKTFECAFEGAAGEAVTITFYLRSSIGTVRAGTDNMGYTASEVTAGSSTITYYRNQWRDIAYSKDLNLAVVVCQDTANINNVMYSSTGGNWYQTESIARQGWVSVEYSDAQKAFMSVATSGTDRVMFSEGYGDLINIPPSLWVKVEDGEEASDLYTHDSSRSVLLKGDGVKENPGYIYQKLPFDSLYDAGELYIMLAYAHLEGLTKGSYHVDLYAGGTIIKELVWDANTEDTTPKEIRFRFDQIPSSVYIRVRGADTPNEGSRFYCGYTLVSKVSEYENGDVGAEIITDGYYDCVPNVKLRGVGAKTSSGTSGRVKEDTDGDIFTTTSTTYQLIKTVTLPALTGGSVYQLNRVALDFKTNNTGAYIYCKTTIKAASLYGGKETDISLYTTNLTTYQHRIYDIPWDLLSASNEQVTFKWYIRISMAGATGFATKLYQKFTEVIDQSVASATPIYIYNNYNPHLVLQLCNCISPGFMVEINKDSTGSIRYVEPFEDDRYLINAYDVSGSVARDETTQTILMSTNSYLVYKFDTLYAVAGVPFFKCYSVEGNPQISIARDESGVPGTFYPVDSNTGQTIQKAEVIRQLDKQGTLSIRGLNKFYVKIASPAGQTVKMGQMLIYAALDTIDAQRILIYVSQKPNSIGVLVEGEGKCSAILSLEYRKTQILP